MSTFKDITRIGIIIGADLVLGTTIGHFIDSWFPFSDEGASPSWNSIAKDIGLSLAQSTTTVYLALALRKDLLGDDYLATDTTNGNVMMQALFYGQTNFWRRIDNIYQTIITNRMNRKANQNEASGSKSSTDPSPVYSS